MEKIFAENKRGLFKYIELEKFQAGIVLTGQEVKSIRNGRVNLTGSYVVFRGEELFLIGCHIPAYQPKNLREDYNAEQSRKLLLTKNEIRQLIGKTQQKGLTMIPKKVYSSGNKIKVEFILGKGKKQFDKREKIKERETNREIQRALKN